MSPSSSASTTPTLFHEFGHALDRGEAYRQFRGRDPEVEALLRLRGFPLK